MSKEVIIEVTIVGTTMMDMVEDIIVVKVLSLLKQVLSKDKLYALTHSDISISNVVEYSSGIALRYYLKMRKSSVNVYSVQYDVKELNKLLSSRLVHKHIVQLLNSEDVDDYTEIQVKCIGK